MAFANAWSSIRSCSCKRCSLHVAVTGQAMVGPPRGERVRQMDHQLPTNRLPRAQVLAERALSTLQRFLHVEAVSGVVLLIAAAIGLIWANLPFAHSYHAFWHLPLSIGLGEFVFSKSLHFWINDALMTVIFLVVGMEIRRRPEQARPSGVACHCCRRRCHCPRPDLPEPQHRSRARQGLGDTNCDGYRLCGGRARPAGSLDSTQFESLPVGSRNHRRCHCRPDHRLLLLWRTSVQRLHRRGNWHPNGSRVSADRSRLSACLYPAGCSCLDRLPEAPIPHSPASYWADDARAVRPYAGTPIGYPVARGRGTAKRRCHRD